MANGFDEAKALREFQDLTPEERQLELWLTTRYTAYELGKLKELITGSSVNAYLMRIRNALTWIAPIAALVLTGWVVFHG